MNLIYNEDVDLSLLNDLKIGIIGYGNQGKAQALNLNDRKFKIKIGIRLNSDSIKHIKRKRIAFDTIVNVVKWADIISVLIPDTLIPEVYNKHIKPNLNKKQTLLFSHGFNIHYNLIQVPKNVNIIMVAPSGGGNIVRSQFVKGKGVPSLIAVENDFTGNSLEIAKAYAKGIGSTRVCSFISTFKEETETDLFGEQVLLTGGIPYMINKSLKVLLESGYSPVVAWFVCYYEIKTIVDLFHQKGFDYLYRAISDTARYGGITRGGYLIDEDIENKMKKILSDIQKGRFKEELSKQNTNVDYSSGLNPKDTKKINELIKKVFKTEDEN